MSANPLDVYAAELRRWNKAINLVSPATVAELETRHIADSLQLADFLPSGPITLMDWGSGGGLPGLVLALARMDDTVHLVESDQKKAAFLDHVSRETKRDRLYVHHVRIESLPMEALRPDVVTARALAPLPRLLGWMLPWSRNYPQLYALFPKGKNWRAEVADARQAFDFTLEDHPSATDPDGRILRIGNLTVSRETAQG